MLVWGFVISTVALYHGTFTITSLSHRFGRRRIGDSGHWLRDVHRRRALPVCHRVFDRRFDYGVVREDRLENRRHLSERHGAVAHHRVSGARHRGDD